MEEVERAKEGRGSKNWNTMGETRWGKKKSFANIGKGYLALTASPTRSFTRQLLVIDTNCA